MFLFFHPENGFDLLFFFFFLFVLTYLTISL